MRGDQVMEDRSLTTWAWMSRPSFPCSNMPFLTITVSAGNNDRKPGDTNFGILISLIDSLADYAKLPGKKTPRSGRLWTRPSKNSHNNSQSTNQWGLNAFLLFRVRTTSCRYLRLLWPYPGKSQLRGMYGCFHWLPRLWFRTLRSRESSSGYSCAIAAGFEKVVPTTWEVVRNSFRICWCTVRAVERVFCTGYSVQPENFHRWDEQVCVSAKEFCNEIFLQKRKKFARVLVDVKVLISLSSSLCSARQSNSQGTRSRHISSNPFRKLGHCYLCMAPWLWAATTSKVLPAPNPK